MFLIIHDDKPLYELIFQPTEKQPVKEYFLVHAALDSIDTLIKTKKEYFLGLIKIDDQAIYAFINSVNVRMLLVLKKEVDKTTEKSIKEFLVKTNEALALAFLNPMYKIHDGLKSNLFDEKVRNFARESLRSVISQKKK